MVQLECCNLCVFAVTKDITEAIKGRKLKAVFGLVVSRLVCHCGMRKPHSIRSAVASLNIMVDEETEDWGERRKQMSASGHPETHFCQPGPSNSLRTYCSNIRGVCMTVYVKP